MAEFGRSERQTNSNLDSVSTEMQPLIFAVNDLPSTKSPRAMSASYDGSLEIALLSLERAGQMTKQVASDADELSNESIVLARADQSRSRGKHRNESKDEDERSRRRDNEDRPEKKTEKNEAVEKLLSQIVKTAREHWGDKIWDPENREITNNGELGCAISVSEILMESGAVGKGFKPQLSVTKLDNALRKVNWQLVGDDEPIKPGYVIIGYNSDTNWRAGNGNSHVGIVGEVGFTRNDLLIWNNSSRTFGEPYWKQEGKLLALRPWKYDKTFVLKPPGA
jgi:hypothetical protein